MDTEYQLKCIEEAFYRDSRQSLPSKQPQLIEPIAIVGLSGYLPGCMSVREFWQALDTDCSLIQEIPKERFDWRKYYDATGKNPGKTQCKWGGFIPDVAGFDAHFFKILPFDAKQIDPRQRLLLMSVYQTLCDAGYPPATLKKSRTGVYVAHQDDDYLQILNERGIDPGEGYGQASLLANRIAYFFDFRGPSEIVDAQCAGAAVALHRAVSALRSGEISYAIVSAANLLLRPQPFLALSRTKQLSRTNSVKSFQENADGHLRAEGVVSVMLKPLTQAEADRDFIYALISNTAVNFYG
ncbi:polyketide synthase [Nostoc sp. 2RC]|uniref:beta-ketoacyl [acyl carrier protein] synthase domain-containing protein n=1 Tax=Nostoc sp. 2RC TaxID=2485484 RepID=UPI001623A618|nr:polyketide synthase [Nostoc sp. 2RC]MBC1236249.1 polyketide synthase [Nostoc sp. 2RC]